jgi:PKD repeat protein
MSLRVLTTYKENMMITNRRKRVPLWNSQLGRFTSSCAVILTLLANSVVPTTGFADNTINFNREIKLSWNEYQKVTESDTATSSTPTPQTQKYAPYPSSIPYTQEKQEIERIDVPVSQSEDIAIEDVQCQAFSTDNPNVNLWCERVGNEFIIYASSKTPVASLKLSPTSGVAPLTVELDGSDSYDPDGTFLKYEWTAPENQYYSGSENKLTWIADKAGKHKICLVVTDSDNLQDKKCETVVVDVCSYELEPKTFNEFGKQGTSAQVHIFASNEKCAWNIETNSYWLTLPSGNPYYGSQTLNFSLTKNSSTEPKPRCGSLTLAKEQSVKICQKGNQKPIADLTILEPSQDNHAPLTVKLDATASSDDGPISYHWDHDGQLLSESNGQATIRYDKEGDYTIRLTVKDEEGETAFQSKHIKVLPPLYTLIVKSTINGRVKVDHAEDYCTPPSCLKLYQKDTLVNLKAIPSTDSIFTGWTDDCRDFGNAPSCQIKMTQPFSTVMANFKRCDYQIEGKKTAQFNANRHQGTLKIMSPNGCQWQAESNQPDWLSIEGDSHRNGNSTIHYSVKLNPNEKVRNGTITIKQASQTPETFSVTQTGNQPPTASFTATPLEGKAPLTVLLNATESNDPENKRIDYEWTSSDKQPLSGATPQIIYPNAGRYTIDLVVHDEYGIASTHTTRTINVALPTYTLTVNTKGSGTVKVKGIDCGHPCSQEYEQGASLILTADANSDAVFSGWNGACSSNTIPTSCKVLMTQPQTVTANFTSCYKEYAVTIDSTHYDAKGGHGNISVTAPKGCQWEAKSEKAWLTITSGFSGEGKGHITYSLNPNHDNKKREGKLMIAGKTFIISQQGRESENLVINKVGDGKGRVTGAGIDCGDDCDEQYPQDTTVTLTAIPFEEAIFEGWGGPCTGNDTICTVKMSQTQTVIARFISKPFLNLIIDGTGTGQVSLETVETRDACYKADKVCRHAYDKNTSVILTANHAEDSQFVGWNGDCSGITETCAVSLDKTKIVTATFNRLEGGPEACFTFSYYSETPLTIEAEADSRCHQDREIDDYQWETSDGQSGTGQTIRFSFDKLGKYTLTLKVTDEMGAEGTSTQTIIFDEQLVFVGLKPFYKLGEKLEVDLIENLQVDNNRFERVDLWVAVQLPDNRFLFRVSSIIEPFSSEEKAFRSSLELEDKRHRILDFTVSPGLGGNYTLYAVYVQEGQNPIDDFRVLKSNLARATTVLYNR